MMTQMGAEVGNLHFKHTRNLENLMVDRGRGVGVEFPIFGGENPRGWLRKCYRYFMLNHMTDIEKILLASFTYKGMLNISTRII